MATNQTRLVPLIGGEPRPFLSGNAIHPSWSPDGASLVYFRAVDGDPLYIADRSGGNAREIFKDQPGIHNHNPIWSPDGEWVYFVHGDPDGEKMDISRIRPSGATPETVTDHGAPVNFVTPLDARTLLFVAPAEDRSGPWLWSLDVQSKQTRRVTTGLEQYLSVAASADGRRIVATVANPSASLWSVPVLNRVADERDMRPLPVPSVRALGPRFHSGTLFYLSSRGAGDGLWRAEKGQTSEIWKGSDGPLGEPAAVSRDGRRVAIVTRRGGRGRVTVMNADGSDSRDVSSAVDVRGVVDWSPEGTSIAAGGIDADGAGLFVLPLDGGTATRLTKGLANNPAWSPDGSLIVYGGPNVGGRQAVLGVHPRRRRRADAIHLRTGTRSPTELSLHAGRQGARVHAGANNEQGILGIEHLDRNDATDCEPEYSGRDPHVRPHSRWYADRLRSPARKLGHRLDRAGGTAVSANDQLRRSFSD